MIKGQKKIRLIYLFIDIAVISFSFYAVRFILVPNDMVFSAADPKAFSLLFTFWTCVLIFMLNLYRLYYTERSLTIPEETTRVFKAVGYSAVLFALVVFAAKADFFPRRAFALSVFTLFVNLSLWRAVKRMIVRYMVVHGYNNFNVLIVGAGKSGREVAEAIKANPYLGLRIAGFLDDYKESEAFGYKILGRIEDFTTVAKKYFIDEVVITIPSEKEAVLKLIKQVKSMHLGIRIVPEHYGLLLPVLDIGYLGVVPLLTYKERSRHPAELALKRLFDFTLALLLVILLSPLFVAIAILIKLDSPGPLFYVHRRMGCRGRPFNFYKFRSMVRNADALKSGLLDKNEVKDGIIFKIKKDPRITRVGSFLRKHSLDELPQLFNVLKGDMGLVGPRPFPWDESQKLGHNYITRLNIRPGITGLAQIRGRSDLSLYHWVKWDLWYLNNWSFGLDLKILWWTLPVIFRGEGAY